MFDHLIKGTRAVLDLVFTKKTPGAASTTKSEATPEQPKAPTADKPFKKPKLPVATIVILAAILVATLYVEMHLMALAAGLALVCILGGYVLIQKVVDAANLAVPDPGAEPGPWPWPTSESMGGATT